MKVACEGRAVLLQWAFVLRKFPGVCSPETTEICLLGALVWGAGDGQKSCPKTRAKPRTLQRP